MKKLNIENILSILKSHDTFSQVEILLADEIEKRCFYKIRCRLDEAKYIDMKFIQTEKEFYYSYQIFSNNHIARWDNSPHYPDLGKFPHHFHNSTNNVSDSQLTGNPEKDLLIIIEFIKNDKEDKYEK
jgi:hypothetical protein